MIILEDNTYKRIAEEFIGDGSLRTYGYKSGGELVDFFNKYFNYSDTYGQGFPSRWYYVSEKIKSIGLEKFFNTILRSKYLRVEESFLRENVEEAIREAITKFNEILDPEDLRLNQGFDNVVINQIVDHQLLGQGGFAKVYFVHQTKSVIKILDYILRKDDSAVTRFRREYEITNSLREVDGIMRVYNYDNDRLQYEMEYCDMTLEKYKPYKKSRQIKHKMLNEIFTIMEKVHSREVLHRDLTPTNIFIKEEAVIIGDFGLGKDLAAEYSRHTQETRGVGQYNYIAPEQEVSLKNASYEADVYSMGRLMNFILTGSPKNSNHECGYLSEKATAQTAENRYSNANHFYQAYKDFVELRDSSENNNQLELEIISEQFSEKTNIYLSSMNTEDLSDRLAERIEYIQAIVYLLESKPDSSNDIIIRLLEGIRKGYPWISYDNFSSIAYQVLKSQVVFPYDTKVTAANLLSYIAHDINRYNAQSLIEKLKNLGIEPTLEEILNNN